MVKLENGSLPRRCYKLLLYSTTTTTTHLRVHDIVDVEDAAADRLGAFVRAAGYVVSEQAAAPRKSL